MARGNPDRSVLGVVTGLKEEARIARLFGDVEVGGGTSWGAEVAAEKLVSRGVTALLSFGLCGALDPTLRAGDIVIPLAVLETGDSYATDGVLAEAAGGWFGGMIVASETIVITPEAKRRLFEHTRAAAVDMESGAVARVAVRHDLPFAVVRAVCDTASLTLPPAAMVALNDEGSLQIWQVLRSLWRRPRQLPDLLRVGRDAAVARRALLRVARAMARRLAIAS
jgi:adenosylhomocysteine nucleosidase